MAKRNVPAKRRALSFLRATASGLTVACCLAGSALAQAPLGKVGVDLPLLTTPFWQSYNHYLPIYAKQMGVDIFQPINADGNPAKQITDVNNLIDLGAKGLVISPLESAAVAPALNAAARKNIPVVAVDVAPLHGPVAIVVRADNRAYGEKSCKFIGEHVSAGYVIEIQGDLASVNGRDRSEAFASCLQAYPNLKLLTIPAVWQADAAAAGLNTLLTEHPHVKAIYMQAGGVYLAPTLQTLRRKHLLVPAGQPGHIVIVSNDGISQELAAIRDGEIDATISQPADLYAKYALFYIKEAMEGKTFKVGPTDHGSQIVEISPGVLEDELPAPLVTKANVNDPNLWGNQIKQ